MDLPLTPHPVEFGPELRRLPPHHADAGFLSSPPGGGEGWGQGGARYPGVPLVSRLDPGTLPIRSQRPPGATAPRSHPLRWTRLAGSIDGGSEPTRGCGGLGVSRSVYYDFPFFVFKEHYF